MTVKSEKFDVAHRILEQFERQILDAKDFNWNYIVENSGISKPTLWRNIVFRQEFERVKDLVAGYRKGKKVYNAELSVQEGRLREKDLKIQELEIENARLKSLLNTERERLAYAAVVSRRKNIDPVLFLDETPLTRRVGKKVKNLKIKT